MTRRQLSPPSALSQRPLPIVPAQIVYLPAMLSSLGTPSFRRKPGPTVSAVAPLDGGVRASAGAAAELSVRAFPAGMRDVDDDTIRPGPLHLEIGMHTVPHRGI